MKEHEDYFSGCGGLTIPTTFKDSDFTVVPFSYDGFYGRHCAGEPEKNCDTEDDETFLILVPYVSSCTRTTTGANLAYKMTFEPNFSGGKDKVVGPTRVKISE